MDVGGKVSADVSSRADSKESSIIENSTEAKIRNLQDIQDFANKIVSLKISLLGENIRDKRPSFIDSKGKNPCIADMNAANDGEGQETSTTIVPDATTVMPLCSNNLNNGPKFPNGDNFTDNVEVKLPSFKAIKESSKDCSKIDDEMKNQVLEDKLVIKESKTVSGFYGDKCNSNHMNNSCEKVSEDIDADTKKDTVLEAVGSDSPSHSEVAKSCDILQDTDRTDLSNRETSHVGSLVLGEVMPVTEVEDMEIVVDDTAYDTTVEQIDSADNSNNIIEDTAIQTMVAKSSVKKTGAVSSSFHSLACSEVNESCQNGEDEYSDVMKEVPNVNNTEELDDKMEIVIDDHSSNNSVVEGCRSYENNNGTGTEDDTERSKSDKLAVEKESSRTEDEVIVVDDAPSDIEIDVVNIESPKVLHSADDLQNESSNCENSKLISTEPLQIGVESNEKVNASGCEDGSDKTKENNTLQPFPIVQRGRRSRAHTKSAPLRYSPPPLTPNPARSKKRGRARNSENFEITDDVLLPFKLGWLREVVERATCSSPKRMWDVYYRSPDGTKLRSTPDVMNYLRQHPECALGQQNFTFCRTFIYREPFEVRRKAKVRTAGVESSPKVSKQQNKTPTMEKKSASREKDEKTPKKENNTFQESKSNKTPSPKNKLERFSQTSVSSQQDKPEVIICDDNDDEPPTKKAKPNSHTDGSSTDMTTVQQEVNKSIDKHAQPVLKELHDDSPGLKRKDSYLTRSQFAARDSVTPLNINEKMNEPVDKRASLVLRQLYCNRPGRKRKDAYLTRSQFATGDPLNIYEKVHMRLVKPRNDYSRSFPKLYNTSRKDAEVRKEQDNTKRINAASTKNLASQIRDRVKKFTARLPTSDKAKKVHKSSDEDLPQADVNLCSNHCPGSFGEIPSLQCIVCLCLFHPKCMGLHKASSTFICKRCEAKAIKLKPRKEKSQDKHKSSVQTKAQSLTDSSLQQNGLDSSDEENATNVSVLTPEVVIQHDGSDQEEIPMPRMVPYCFPNSSTASTNTVSTCGQYNTIAMKSKSNCIRPIPPLKPIPTLTPAPHLANQLLASKRIVTSSTYFPPSANESYSTYSILPSTTSNTLASTNYNCPPLIGIPPVGSPATISQQQLSNTVPQAALVPRFNTGPPPLRLVTTTSIPTNVVNGSRITLPNNPSSCLVLNAPSNVFRAGTTTQLIGPFPSNSIPQIMLVNNKVVCVIPVTTQQTQEQKANSVLTNVISVPQSLSTSSAKGNAVETRRNSTNIEQNNPYLSALLNSKEKLSYMEGVNAIPGNISSNITSSVVAVDGKVTSSSSPKLTAIIPPSFPMLRSSSVLHCTNVQVTTSANFSLPTVSSVSGNRTSRESPSYSNESSYSRDSHLMKHLEETIKLCLSTTQTSVLNNASPPVLHNASINKRVATATTTAIKSPMTTARLLRGTESSLSPPKSVSHCDKSYDSSCRINENKIKLDVSSSASLTQENHQNGKSSDAMSSCIGSVQNTVSAKLVSSGIELESIRDQPFRTTSFSPSFTSLLNTMTSCYSCLNNIFQYLSTMDLLRAKLVCKCWYRLASQQFLWRKVSLKNLIIVDWKKFAFALDLHGTTYLDMRGHGLLHSTWPCFVSVLSRLDKIRHIEYGLIPAFVLYAMASKLVDLKSLSGECAMFSHWTTGKVGPCVINFNLLENFRQMEKFQLRCQEGLMATVVGGLSPLSHLSKLRHLSLTTLENIDCEQFKFLKKLNNLEALEIGDCSNWTPEIYSYVGRMVKLKTLRLEKGGESDGLVDALSNLKRLEELQLVIYKIPALLEVSLKALVNLRLLSIWPDTTINGSFQNYKVLHTVRSLNHLQELRWVVLSATCTTDNEVPLGREGSWRNRLEDYKECQIDFSEPIGHTPLMSVADLKGVVKSLPLKDNSQFITIKGLYDTLQEALPSTKIKIFQVPLKQLRKYSAFR